MPDEGYKRKLTASFSADAVGYSRIMRDDEEATIRTLTEYRETITTQVNQHNGRVVDSPGDNVLAEFASVVDAARCAVETQKQIAERNADLPENRIASRYLLTSHDFPLAAGPERDRVRVDVGAYRDIIHILGVARLVF